MPPLLSYYWLRSRWDCLAFLLWQLSFKVGEGLKNGSNCEASVPIDTDYVELSMEGFDEAKDTINSIGTLISSSCIPSLSSAGLLLGLG